MQSKADQLEIATMILGYWGSRVTEIQAELFAAECAEYPKDVVAAAVRGLARDAKCEWPTLGLLLQKIRPTPAHQWENRRKQELLERQDAGKTVKRLAAKLGGSNGDA